ncbi:MAG: MFS transporter, partial [Nitrospinota bacterium]
QALQGLGSSLFVTNGMSFIMRITPANRMGVTMSTYQGSFSLGVSLGPILGGFLASQGGLRLPFFVYGFLAAVSAALAWVFIRTPTAPEGARPRQGLLRQGGEIKRLFGSYEFLLALALSALIFWVRSGIRLTILPLYARDVAGMDTFYIGLLLSIITATNLIVLWPAGRAVDRSRKAVAVGSALATALSIVAFGWADTLPLLVLVSVAFGISTGFCGVAPAVVASDVMPSRIRGTGLGVFRMAGDLGFILGPLIGGLGITYLGYFRTFFVFVGGALIVSALAAKMKETLNLRRPPPSGVEPAAPGEWVP